MYMCVCVSVCACVCACVCVFSRILLIASHCWQMRFNYNYLCGNKHEIIRDNNTFCGRL